MRPTLCFQRHIQRTALLCTQSINLSLPTITLSSTPLFAKSIEHPWYLDDGAQSQRMSHMQFV
jgi:hypothetical protein